MSPQVKGFTLVELVIAITLVGILAAVALPRFMNLADDAEENSFEAQRGAVISALAVAKSAYSLGDTAGLPPDADDNGYPDHFGDTGNPDVDTLRGFMGGIMEYPLPNARYGGVSSGPGWISYPQWLPHTSGRYYYCYDSDANGACNSATDSRIYYDPAAGRITQDYYGAG